MSEENLGQPIEATNEARQAEAKQYRQKANKKAKAKPKAEDVSYRLIEGKKVVKIIKTKDGNAYSQYVGPYKKFSHLLKD